MRHPDEQILALHAGGDLRVWERLKTEWHLRSCPDCRREVAALQAAIEEARLEAAPLPPGLKWDRLALEMTANIHVGLEAAECVGPVRESVSRVGWRAAAVMAGMSVILLAAWWLNPPYRQPQHVLRAAPRVEIRTSAAGIELHENGAALTMLHRAGRENVRPIILSSPGALRARYIDSETGQVTINHVYAE